MQCESLSLQLAAVADGLSTLPPSTQRHVEYCLRCQAELAQYRKLLKVLTSLRHYHLAPGEGLLDEILALFDEPVPITRLAGSGSRSKKVAYIGGIAAAATAGAAGAIVLAARYAGRQGLAS